MAGILEVMATAYVSDEIYGKPTTKFGKNYPLTAYGYDKSCANNIEFLLNFDFDCTNMQDERCQASFENPQKSCVKNPFDSRCYTISANKKSLQTNLKNGFQMFNENEPIQNSFKIILKDFKNGTSKEKLYFNFKRSPNFGLSPKIIKLSDFNITNIKESDFFQSDKNFIKASPENPSLQANSFSNNLDTNETKAHFYYGYVSSLANTHYICEDNNRSICQTNDDNIDISIMIFGDNYCEHQLCKDNFLDIFQKQNFVKTNFYKNPYDNYNQDELKDFVKYIESIKFKLSPILKTNQTSNGTLKIDFIIPKNIDFNSDEIRVYAPSHLINKGLKRSVNETTKFNSFDIILYEPERKENFGANLDKSSKNLTRRVRY